MSAADDLKRRLQSMTLEEFIAFGEKLSFFKDPRKDIHGLLPKI